MADVVVTNIEKAKSGSPKELITALGNPNTPQGGWRWTREQVIASIEAGSNTFFVKAPHGKRLDLQVFRPEHGEPYLRTLDEGKATEHLFELAEFPKVVSE
jgi:hypothetical protein